MTTTAFLTSKTRAQLVTVLQSPLTQALLADPEFKRELAEAAREVSELAETRRQARIIRTDVISERVSI